MADQAAQFLGGAGFVEPGAVARYWRQGQSGVASREWPKDQASAVSRFQHFSRLTTDD